MDGIDFRPELSGPDGLNILRGRVSSQIDETPYRQEEDAGDGISRSTLAVMRLGYK